jgi:hypothetical protein
MFQRKFVENIKPHILCAVKNKVGLVAEGVLYSYPNEFLHSSPEALHTPSGVRDLC